MLKEYNFYYRYESCPFLNIQDDIFIINKHRVSQEFYNQLYNKVGTNHSYKILSTQNSNWENYKTKCSSYIELTTFERGD